MAIRGRLTASAQLACMLLPNKWGKCHIIDVDLQHTSQDAFSANRTTDLLSLPAFGSFEDQWLANLLLTPTQSR